MAADRCARPLRPAGPLTWALSSLFGLIAAFVRLALIGRHAGGERQAQAPDQAWPDSVHRSSSTISPKNTPPPVVFRRAAIRRYRRGRRTAGSVRTTLVRGTTVWDDGKILTQPGHGRFVRRATYGGTD